MDEAKLIKAVEHYQKNLERYSAKNEDGKILHCIERLGDLPIQVTHLEKTGVGRTVNGLRKLGGDVGEAARALVNKWKNMVAQDGDESEVQDKRNSSHSSEDCSENESQSSQCEEPEEEQESPKREQVHESSRQQVKDKSRKHDKKESRSSKHDDRKRSKDDSSRRRKEKEEEKQREEKRQREEIKRKEELEEIKRKEEQEEAKRKEELKKKEERKRREEEAKRKEDKEKKNGDKSSSKRKRDDEADGDMNGHKHRKSDESKETKSDKKSSSSSSSKHSSKRKTSDEARSDEKKHKSSSSKDKKESKSSGSSKKKKVLVDDGIDCESGTSFAEALGMLIPDSPKVTRKSAPTPRSAPPKTVAKIAEPAAIAPLPEKLEPIDVNIATMLPSISTNYKPLGNTFHHLDLNCKAKKVHDDEALSRLMYAKNQRTKVYSGNKVAFSKLPTLFELCTRILQDNIEALEYTGGVPYAILKPVLEKATPDQLFSLEHHNPYIIDDSDELWNFHCQKEFRSKKRQEMETWRDMYMRCLDEREAKLKALTANIKLSQDKSIPVRQTKLAYVDSVVKPPRNIAKKQAKNGLDNKKPMITPSSRLSAIATAGAAGQVSVPNHVSERSSSSSSSSYSKPKKAPLMAKTLQLMKGRFRR